MHFASLTFKTLIKLFGMHLNSLNRELTKFLCNVFLMAFHATTQLCTENDSANQLKLLTVNVYFIYDRYDSVKEKEK